MGGGRAFDELMADLDPAMLIATVADGEGRAGCLVGFGTACSVDPRRFIVCLSKRNRTYRVAIRTGAMAVHPVPAGAADLAYLFGGETGDEVDKFARADWREGPLGLPILDRCGSWFAGRTLDSLDAGDHVAFLLEPVAAERGPEREFLRLRDATRIEPGHEA
jgi:flavin reductase (DIM6/NTAB) family NADH-FMN oxidoreductase RutF